MTVTSSVPLVALFVAVIAPEKPALTVDTLDPYEIINLGNHRPESVLDFVSILEELSGEKAVVKLVPPEPGDVEATYADIARAQHKLGFNPRTSLREGLTVFVEWYKVYPQLTDAVRRFRIGGAGR